MITLFRKSITIQMSLLVLACTALVLALVEIYSYVETRKMILADGEALAVHLTRSMTRRMEQEFRAVEKLPEMLALTTYLKDEGDEEAVSALLTRVVENNPEIFGTGIYLKPGTRAVSSLYSFRGESGIRSIRLDDAEYDYAGKPFFVLPRFYGTGVWTDPYYDRGGGDIIMSTYAVPIYTPGQKGSPDGFRGTVTADVSMKWLRDLTRSVHMGESGFSFIITGAGVFVVHPDPDLVMNASIFSQAEKLNSPKLRAIGRKMVREPRGFMAIGPVLAGQESYLAWDRIPSPGWTLGTLVVKDELFRTLDLLAQQSVGIGLASMALLVLVSILVARSLAGPLKTMAGTTRRIARGDLDVDLSHIRRRDEIGVLAHSIEDMAEGLRQKEFIRDTFGRYLTKEVVARLLESEDGLKLGGEARQITLMMSDLRGFTTLTANMDPSEVIEFLNRYLGRMVDILVAHQGVIDEIIGDGILAFFGAPEPMADHTAKAVACALDMQLAMADINRENQALGLARLEMGIAVHTGTVVVGNIGSETRSKYGAVGSDVNFTGRMESYSVGGQVLVSQAVAGAMGDRLVVREEIIVRMKGMPDPVALYDINGLDGRVLLPEKQERIDPLTDPLGVIVRRLNKKSLDNREIQAILTHTSETSAMVTFTETVNQWENVRVTLPDGMGAFYGKIVRVEDAGAGIINAQIRTTSLSSEAYPLFGAS